MKFLRCLTVIPHNLDIGVVVQLTYDQWERRRHCLEALEKGKQHKGGDKASKAELHAYRIKEPIIFKAGETVFIDETAMKAKAMRQFYEDQDAPKESPNPAPAEQASSQAQESEESQSEQPESSDADGSADENEEQDENVVAQGEPTESIYSTWGWKKLKKEVEARGGVWSDKDAAIAFLIEDDNKAPAEQE